jgi:photosystem II stability/assembly factor-like uncharacterized protein
MEFRVLLCYIFFFNLSFSQQLQQPSPSEISTLPLWAQKMYTSSPNVYEVDSLYVNFYRTNTFQKNYHTQYYKRWRRSVTDRINADGSVKVYSAEELALMKQNYLAKQSGEKSSNWSLVGPIHNTEGNASLGSGQTNVYAIDQCADQPAILYLGTEPGEVYKSIDGGLNWTNSSMNENFGSGVTAIEVHFSNPNIVFAGGNDGVFKSTDGGSTWTNVMPESNLNVNEILINSGNDQIVMAATDKGLFRSTNGGTSWTSIFTQASYDIKENAANNSIIYLLKNNPSLIICEFYSSSDSGATWTLQSNGWYSSNDPARSVGGGRLAVTPADPNRVYAYLIGEAKANDYGFIGVYKSTDGGTNWTLPNGPAGGPYTATHLNLAYGYPAWTYHQGFYNCAIVASTTNADHILVGGLNLYRSNDGAANFTSVAGYVGGPLNIHVDMQDFRMINGETWVTTDGGVYKSTDFFNSAPTFMMDGVHGSDFWGFGSGWNEDVLVGGLYHNGNLAYYENYGNGVFLELGGGEAPTGYVNPGNNRKTYFSDISGKYIPLNLNDPILNFSNGMSPNESYYAAESSEMEFHPDCYTIAFIGKDNKLWKTTDGGGSYSLLHTFGAAANNFVNHIEISSSNPDVMYVHQRPSSGSTGTLWKTIDGGVSWNTVTLPAGNSRRAVMAVNPQNENELWIAFTGGSNGNKVYKTANGGTSWTNLTSALLNNESIHSIVHVAGTDGGIYVGTNNAVFYRNNSTNWVIDNTGLPTYMSTNILRPFYRDGKIRMASYGKGIWESSFNEQPSEPICRIMVDKLQQTVFCSVDSFYFEDYSFLNHQGASWSWSFPTGLPASSTERNPAVFFANTGTHLAVLTITDQFGNTDQDSLYVTVTEFAAQAFVNEDFQSTFLPAGWFQTNYDNNAQWEQTDDAGGFGNSTQSAIFRNFDLDSQGTDDDMNITMNTLNTSAMNMSFDVAYAQYGGQYSDTLEVLVSTDCGANFTSVFLKGGTTLGTAPTNTSYFTPAPSEWRTETMDLSAFTNFEKVIVAFRNKGHWGNNIYVDNINITSDLGIEETAKQFDIYPNPLVSGGKLYLEGIELGAKIILRDLNGKTILNQTISTNEISLPPSLQSGVYWINIQTENSIWNKKLLVKGE